MIPFPNKKYNIIYADPAWHFKTYSNKGEKRSATQHYNCMSINDIYDLPINDISKSVRQLIVSKLQQHSKKPDCVRDRIIELCGDLPKIELFARQKVEGWDSWGNEV